MTSNIEIAGLILIILGILYTFLKALGKFDKGGEEGEIESKMFTLKGGPGIILVGLGVLLLIIGFSGENPQSSSNTNSLESSQIATEKTVENQFSSQPTVQPIVTAQPPSPTMAPEIRQTPASEPAVTVQEQRITNSFLLGTWKSQFDAIAFYYDGSCLLEDNTGTVYIGTYTISGSVLTIVLNMKTTNFLINYIDQNTIKINSDTYIRVA